MVFKLKENSRKLKNIRYEQTNGCDVRCGLTKKIDDARATRVLLQLLLLCRCC